MIPVKIKLTENGKMPTYATDQSAGFDLYASETIVIEPGETKLIPLGVMFEIPLGYEIQIRPRSGISLKTKLRQSNGVGTIDADYRGEVSMMFDNIFHVDEEEREDLFYETLNIEGDLVDVSVGSPAFSYIIQKGDRICQGILAKAPQAQFIQVDELSDTDRGSGGFGHTGTK